MKRRLALGKPKYLHLFITTIICSLFVNCHADDNIFLVFNEPILVRLSLLDELSIILKEDCGLEHGLAQASCACSWRNMWLSSIYWKPIQLRHFMSVDSVFISNQKWNLLNFCPVWVFTLEGISYNSMRSIIHCDLDNDRSEMKFFLSSSCYLWWVGRWGAR